MSQISTSQSRSLLGTTPAEENSFEHRMVDSPSQLWERMWVWLSERINPIVVKEVRQSLKSKQFTISFGLTLIAAVGWTLVSISLTVPRIYFVPGGLMLLSGYFCILAFPLMVIIPFSAFRSLTSETEDSTFELLSISALSALQIIHGKMASAMLQILLYLSALAPCIVLTYLLRGVSLFTILFLLGWTVAFSICETALAILFAAAGRSRLVQNGVSVLILFGLFMGFFAWMSLLFSEGLDDFSNPPREIYMLLLAVAICAALLISLVLRAGAAAIDFPSENHSTPLRLRLLFFVAVVVFWGMFGIAAGPALEGGVVLVYGVFIFLMILGSLVTGEHGIISPRAQRSLPRSFFGRVFNTWLFPGAGLGYIFLCCLFGGVAITLSALELYMSNEVANQFGSLSVTSTGYLLLCYLVLYLGVNRLLLLLVSRTLPNRMLGAFALMAVILVFAHLIPWTTVFYLNDYRNYPYGWHQALNIPWTVWEAMEVTPFSSLNSEIGLSTILLTLGAILVFGLNLMLSTRDVLLVRVAEPPRVREDEQTDEPDPAPVDPFAPDPDEPH